jgi:hypothetical protein
LEAITKVRVFVASPGDVVDERRQMVDVVTELNQTLGPILNLSIELVRWDTHAYAAPGPIQPNITEQIGDYDILVGIMWKRFGTRTQVAGSGTEEEFRIAHENWGRDGKPHIMFYFCEAPLSPRMSSEEMQQLQNVNSFRAEISRENLTFSYESHADFAKLVRPQLINVLNAKFSKKVLDEYKEKRDNAVDRKKYDDAFDSLFKAARKTRAYLRSLGTPESWDDITNEELSGLWGEAYKQLTDIGERDLAARCMVKSLGWEDGTLWGAPNYIDMPIDVDTVFTEALSTWQRNAPEE